MNMDQDQGRLDDKDFGEDDSEQSWYFDLPKGAWERQEQKNRELRERILRNVAEEPERKDVFSNRRPSDEGGPGSAFREQPEADRNSRQSPGGTWQFNRAPASFEEARDPRRPGPVLPQSASQGTDDDDYSTEPSVESAPIPLLRRFRDEVQQEAAIPKSGPTDIFGHSGDDEPADPRPRSHWDEMADTPADTGFSIESMKAWATGEPDSPLASGRVDEDGAAAEEESVGAFAWSDEPRREEPVPLAQMVSADELEEVTASDEEITAAVVEHGERPGVAPMAPLAPLPLRLRRRDEGEEENVAEEVAPGEPTTRWDEMFGAKAADSGPLGSMKAWAEKETEEDTSPRRWLADPAVDETTPGEPPEHLSEPFGWESALQDEENQRAAHDFGTSAEEAPKKKGLFSRIFGRKKDANVPDYVATAGDDWLLADEEPEASTGMPEDDLPPLPEWMEEATRAQDGNDDTAVRWAAVPGQVDSETDDWQPAPVEASALKAVAPAAANESDEVTLAAAALDPWAPAPPAAEPIASLLPGAESLTAALEPALLLPQEDDDFWNPEPIRARQEESQAEEMAPAAQSQDPEVEAVSEQDESFVSMTSSTRDEPEMPAAIATAGEAERPDEAKAHAIMAAASVETLAVEAMRVPSEPADEEDDPFAAFARAVEEAPDDDPFAAFSRAVEADSEQPLAPVGAVADASGDEEKTVPWGFDSDEGVAAAAKLDSATQAPDAPGTGEADPWAAVAAVEAENEAPAVDNPPMLSRTEIEPMPWEVLESATLLEEPADELRAEIVNDVEAPAENESAPVLSASELEPLPWEVEDSPSTEVVDRADASVDAEAASDQGAWAALVSDPDGEDGPAPAQSQPPAFDPAQPSGTTFETSSEIALNPEANLQLPPSDSDDAWADFESALAGRYETDTGETPAVSLAEAAKAPALVAASTDDDEDDFIAAALGRMDHEAEPGPAEAETAPIASLAEDDEDDFVAAPMREIPAEAEAPDDPWASFRQSRSDDEPSGESASNPANEEPAAHLDPAAGDSPPAARDDPWAAIAIASGYDAEAPGGVAVYRGHEGNDSGTALAEPVDVEDESHYFDEGDDQEQSVSGLSERLPEWAGEDRHDDVVLRAFEAHAQGETREERAGYHADADGMAADEAVAFHDLLGEDAAELVAAETDPEQEQHSFRRLQGFHPQRPSGPTRPDPDSPWEPMGDEGSDAWGGRGDGGFGNWSFSEESAPAATPQRNKTKTLVRELVETGLLALLVFLSVRASFQNFKVEGNSMQPTLEDGQFLIVNKLVYSEVDMDKLGDFLPFVNDSGEKNVFHGPERGDIVVLEDPHKPGTDLIKRIIGLPGETVEIVDGAVYINDQLLEEPYIKTPWHDNRGKVGIPAGQYFVMGDNRDNSLDSRSPQVGLIQADRIIGKAMISYWPKSKFGLAPNEGGNISEKDGPPRLTAQRIGD